MQQAKCGARTKAGAPCQRVAVRGVGRCQLHGGGRELKRRYRDELRKTSSQKRREWLLRQLDKSVRNREREHHKHGGQLAEAQRRLAELWPEYRTAVREGRTTMQARNRWIAAVEAVRPYRTEFAMPLIYEALTGRFGPAMRGADTIAGALGLDAEGKHRFMRALGFERS